MTRTLRRLHKSAKSLNNAQHSGEIVIHVIHVNVKVGIRISIFNDDTDESVKL